MKLTLFPLFYRLGKDARVSTEKLIDGLRIRAKEVLICMKTKKLLNKQLFSLFVPIVFTIDEYQSTNDFSHSYFQCHHPVMESIKED